MTLEQRRQYHADYYRAHKADQCLQARESYRRKCKDPQFVKNRNRYHLDYARKNSIKTRRWLRISYMRRVWNMEPEEYDRLLSAQNHQCLICKGILHKGKQTALDHNHVTGKRRGFLCSSCNTGLGSFKDSAELLMQAARYVREEN